MQAGLKVTHFNFTRTEYLEIVDGMIMTEDGCCFDEEWPRKWDDDNQWRIWSDPNAQNSTKQAASVKLT